MIKAVKEYSCLKCDCYYCSERENCIRTNWCDIKNCKDNPKKCWRVTPPSKIPFKERVKKLIKGAKEYDKR